MLEQFFLNQNVQITVVVEDGDLHDAGPAELEGVVVLGLHVGQLQEELLVRLPLVVVHDGYTNLQNKNSY